MKFRRLELELATEMERPGGVLPSRVETSRSRLQTLVLPGRAKLTACKCSKRAITIARPFTWEVVITRTSSQTTMTLSLSLAPPSPLEALSAPSSARVRVYTMGGGGGVGVCGLET